MRYVILAVICSIVFLGTATQLSAHQNKISRKHIDKGFEKHFRGHFDRHFRIYPDHHYKHPRRHFGHMSRGSQIIIILEGSRPPRHHSRRHHSRRHHSRRPPISCGIQERPERSERPERFERPERPRRH